MLVIVPSRGRPHNIKDLIDAWVETEANATLLVALDDDDPQLDNYEAVAKQAPNDEQFQFTVNPRRRLGPTLNEVACRRVERPATLPLDVIGFMGDDHRPRTPHWDREIEDIVKDRAPLPSIIYGNDLIQGQNLPTAVFMTANIIKTLGYMCPPGLVHMYLDNSWLRWGTETRTLVYAPDVIIEHMHPIAGKSDWDEGYVEVNAGSMYAQDEATFKTYCSTRLVYDMNKIREYLLNG